MSLNSVSPIATTASLDTLSPLSTTNLLFVDPSIQNYQQLLTGLQPGITPILLDAEQDGIQQITAALTRYTNITSLHVLSHGSDGGIQLGNNLITTNTLSQYTHQLQSWQSALTPDADILFYGCNIGASDQHDTLLSSLASFTGADIAASSDLTGASALGGNWNLEVTKGTIETSLAFSLDAQASYHSVLLSPTVTLGGTVPQYAENQVPVIIADAAIVTDLDSANFDTGTLTARFTTGGIPSDRLTIAAGGGVTLNGQRIAVGGVEIGTFRGGLGTAENLVITFNSNATPALTETMLRRIAYSNAGDGLPATGTRTVEFVLADGDGDISTPVVRVVDIITATNNNDAPIVGNRTVLYDGSTNQTPNSPGAAPNGPWFSYADTSAILGGVATPTASAGGTTLVTDNAVYAGYSNYTFAPVFAGTNVTFTGTPLNAGFPTLDRAAGYTLNFSAQVNSESRTGGTDRNADGKDDRAGFSVIAISSDLRGIELGFWTNRIWAQDDGTTQTNPALEPDAAPVDTTRTLFTQAEFNASVNTTTVTNYALTILGDTYSLFGSDAAGNGSVLLTGKLRDYTAFVPPSRTIGLLTVTPPNPYGLANHIFFGDDTPSAQANIRLNSVAVTTNTVLPAQTVNEDTPLVVTGIQIADVDASLNTITVTLTAPNGTLTVNNAVANGVPVGNVNNNGTATVTLTGTVNQINTTLADITGLTYQGSANFNGTETLTVTVNDGGNTGGTPRSASRTKTITVTAVNDAPNFTNAGNQTLAPGTNTLQTVANWANSIGFGPANEAGQAVDAFLVTVTSDPNTIFTTAPAVANNGTLTYTPNGTAGTAIVQVRLRDNAGTANGGVDLSAIATFTITVNTNSIPVFATATLNGTDGNITVNEGSTVTLQATATDAEADTLTFTVDGTAAGAIAGAAGSTRTSNAITRTYLDEGTATLTYTVSDGVTVPVSVTRTVTIANIAPTITQGAATTVNMSENGIPTPFALTLNATDPGTTDILTWSIQTQGTNGTASVSASPTGVAQAISYVPTTNFSGTDNFIVQVTDGDGGIAQITVNVVVGPVNNAPSFTNAGNQVLPAGTNTLQTVANWANTFVFGPPDEAGQAVDAFLVTVTSDPNNIFAVPPTVANDGTLTYTPNGTSGTATVNVQLRDNGGTANGGVNLSPIATFTIVVGTPSPSLAIATGTTPDENTLTNGTFILTLSQAPVADLTVNFNLTGSTATGNGTDYTLIAGAGVTAVDPVAGTFTIAAGAINASLIVQMVNDVAAEANETIVLNLTGIGAGYALITPNATLTIAANDTTVTNTNDAGGGSLRQAVTNANTFAGDDIITFDLPAGAQTITLLSGLPNLAGNVQILNTTGANNLAISGVGGFDIFGINAGVTVSFDQLTIRNGFNGIENFGTIAALSNSTISGNLYGIGVNPGGTIVTLNNSTISGNVFDGIENLGTIVSITNTTISGQQSSGIANLGTINTINNVTIAANLGNGLRNDAGRTITTLSNSILAGNGSNLNNAGTITNNTNNQIGSLTSVGINAALANNGGATRTHALLANSPAIDASGIGATTTDQRGITAVSTRDVGAFEAPANVAPTVTAPAAIAVLEDTASALTGISFADPDAATGSVTATFTVGTGTLAATSGSGVAVGGTTTTLTLSGTLAAINTFLAGGNLTYTTGLNSSAAQILGVSINDNGNLGSGGAQSSGITNVTLNITPVNDAPSFTNAGNQTILAGTTTVQTVTNWANTIVFGPADEAGQAVDAFLVIVTSDPNTIFTTAPTIANNGTLTYTPNGTPGTATITVQLRDNGGTANGGVNLSPLATFTITVGSNTPPTVVAGGIPTINVTQDAPNTTIDLATFFNDIQSGGTGLTYTVVNNSNSSLFTSATIAGTTLTLDYAPSVIGTSTLTIRATDPQGAAVDSTVTINVTPPYGITNLQTLGGVEGVYQIGGAPGEQVLLQVDWAIREAAFNNEIGFFIADDALGTINGIAPGDPNYARTALASAGRRVLFASGSGAGSGLDITVIAGSFLVFYLVQDTTTANWLATNPSNSSSGRQVLFSRSIVNPGQFDQGRDRILAPGALEIAWEDLAGGGDQDFNDVVIRITPGAFRVPGTTGNTPVNFAIAASNASFANEFGFFYVDDPSGRIGTLRPGDTGYAAAALATGNFQVVLSSGQRQGSVTPTLQASRFVGWYIIQNASTSDFVLRNLTNSLSGNPIAFFSFAAANPDGIDHFQRISATEFGVEDLTNGGDRDFNDIIVAVTA